MDILALIADLMRQGFQFTPRGDKLAVSPASKLTPELMEILKAYKPEILRLLRSGRLPKQGPTVLYHQDPDPCPRCEQRLWWINSYYSRVCQTCYPASSPEVVLEWLGPQGG
jgi:TubC N-terminal docking domain